MKQKRTITKQFAEYVSMNVLGMIGISLYILADTFFVSNGVGIKGLTALNLAIPVFNLIFAVGLMCGMGGSTRYAILRGEGEHEKAEEMFTQSVYAAAFFAILILAAGLLFPSRIARMLGAGNEVFDLTKNYFVTIVCFTPVFCANHLLNCFIRNDGSPRLAMAAMTAGSLANIVFDYIFIYPLKMGMLGAALATGTSPIVGLLILSRHFKRGNSQFHLISCRPSFAKMADILRLGFSSFINEISSGVVIFVFNMIILKTAGNVGVAAYGVVANVALVISAVFTGIGQGIQPLISRSFGSGDRKSMKKVFHMAVGTAFVLAVISYGIIVLWHEGIVSVFNSEGNRQMAKIAGRGLLIYFTGFLFCGFNIVSVFYFSAASQAGKAFCISTIRGMFAIVAFAVILSHFFGMTGIWLSFPAAEIFTAVFSVLFYKFR